MFPGQAGARGGLRPHDVLISLNGKHYRDVDILGARWIESLDEAGLLSSDPGSYPPLDCSDGVDNNGDTHVDFGGDFGCRSANDLSEGPDCSDGFDNDGDGQIDFGEDPNCESLTAPAEAGGGGRRCGLGFEVSPLLAGLAALRRRRARRA